MPFGAFVAGGFAVGAAESPLGAGLHGPREPLLARLTLFSRPLCRARSWQASSCGTGSCFFLRRSCLSWLLCSCAFWSHSMSPLFVGLAPPLFVLGPLRLRKLPVFREPQLSEIWKKHGFTMPISDFTIHFPEYSNIATLDSPLIRLLEKKIIRA